MKCHCYGREVRVHYNRALNDPALAGYAIMALGKLKSQKARPAIERFLDHPQSWVRSEARKAIKRIDR